MTVCTNKNMGIVFLDDVGFKPRWATYDHIETISHRDRRYSSITSGPVSWAVLTYRAHDSRYQNESDRGQLEINTTDWLACDSVTDFRDFFVISLLKPCVLWRHSQCLMSAGGLNTKHLQYLAHFPQPEHLSNVYVARVFCFFCFLVVPNKPFLSRFLGAVSLRSIFWHDRKASRELWDE